MKARFRKGKLVITLPLIVPPRLSGSGKRLLVATSRGGRRTGLKHGKKPIYVNANAYVRPDEPVGQKTTEISKPKALRKRAGKRWLHSPD
jgi:hypothetical protein